MVVHSIDQEDGLARAPPQELVVLRPLEEQSVADQEPGGLLGFIEIVLGAGSGEETRKDPRKGPESREGGETEMPHHVDLL